ncbi:MAG: UvrB/UvrC motif-containing protein [Planctomycetes bacterium]|nr:UvrB/UvrC motif-containing protein [Planctomycetota bacterium]
MICEKCNKNHATVHVTEVINGVKKEAHLCEECARSTGVGIKFTFSISDILGNLMESKPGKQSERMAQLKCSECGMTYTEFKQKARLGCANDYEVFRAGLVPLLEKIHQATQHVGKTPHTADTQIKKENELVRLKRELDGLVKSESFEKAAEVRDRIRTLETELNKNPEK